MTEALSASGYWMHETTGTLRPVVERYLQREPLEIREIGIMRAYLRQWIGWPGWISPKVGDLRAAIDQIATREDIEFWVCQAEDEGIDPL